MSAPNQFLLMRERRFRPFFFTQFLGAFNDNVFKNSLLIILTFQAAGMTNLSAGVLANLSAGLFILPFFMFSATSGQVCDKYEKSRIIRAVKLFEIGVMTCAAVGFHFHSFPLLLAALFFMGVHSTVFGPVKYAILPQHLMPEELVGGNGLVEMGTFVAILLGEVAGGVLAGIEPNGITWISGAVIAIAAAGYWVSRGVPPAPAAAPELKINWNPVTETWRNLRFISGQRTVFLSVLGISWFWFYGATMLTQFPAFGKNVLHGDPRVVTLLLALFSVGVGAGSLLCERLSGHKVEIGLVPFGSIGLTLFGVDLYFACHALPEQAQMGAVAFLGQPAHFRVILDLVLIGMFGGFYTVPLYALIQSRTEPGHRARVIAGNNILNALFMVVSAGLAVLCLDVFKLTIPQLFLATAALNALVAVYIYTLVPEFLMRFLIWILVHSAYRLEKLGIEHIPEEGAAVLVCNHVTHVDAMVIAAAFSRPVRFVVAERFFRTPFLGFVLRSGRAIAVDVHARGWKADQEALQAIDLELKSGNLVCVFPEGPITHNGEMGPFQPWIEQVFKQNPVPVIPLALSGLWGSAFSRLPSFPGKLFARVTMQCGMPMDGKAATAENLRAVAGALRGGNR